MKKILITFSIVFSLLAVFFSMQFAKSIYINKLMYSEKTAISIFIENEVNNDQINKLFSDLKDKFDVDFYKYIHNTSNEVSIYGTDVSFNGKLKLKSGEYPNIDSDKFLSNKITGDNNQIGQIYFMDKDERISIFPIKNLGRLGGYGGLFYINSCDVRVINNITDILKSELGDAGIHMIHSNINIASIFVDTIQSSPVNAIALILFLILFSFLMIHFAISKGKEISILSIHGYSFKRILRYFFNELAYIFAVSFLISSVIILGIISIFMELHFVFWFILSNLILHIMLLFYAGFLIIIFLAIQRRIYNEYEIIKGKKPFAIVMTLQLLLKYILLAVIVFSFTFVQADKIELNRQLKSNDVWKNTENIYSVLCRYITNDLDKKRVLELKAKKVFEEIEDSVGAFMIRASNYDKLSSGSYLYEANTNEGTDRYSMNGMSIKVNPNYLRMHPAYIFDSAINVLDKLIYDEFTINILVPKSLKEYEDEIKTNFKEGFYFEKIRVGNIYNKEFDKPLDQTKVDSLKVNTIYVKDDIEYFIYDAYIEVDKQNKVINPIVLVDTGNLDPSYYYSYLTNCTFFASEKINPILEIMPVILNNDMGSSYDSVSPIYDQRANFIRELEQKINMMYLFEVILIIGFAFSIGAFNTCYYEKNKYEIYVKRIFGYSTFYINKMPIIINSILTLIILLLINAPIQLKVFLFIFDLLVMALCNIVIFKRTFQKSIKGGH